MHNTSNKNKVNIVVAILFLFPWSGLCMIYLGASTIVYSALVIIVRPFSYRLAYAIMRNWCWTLLTFSGVKLKIEGLENLKNNDHFMFVVNHSSSYDIPILVIGIPMHMNFIAKKELFSIPLFGWGLRAIGHIPLNRDSARKAHASIKRAVKQIHDRRRSMILFPEGTRSVTGRVGDFKQASFSLVKQAGVEMVPVLIDGADTIANKKSWYITPGTVRIIISKPVSVETVSAASKEELKTMAHDCVVAMQEREISSI